VGPLDKTALWRATSNEKMEKKGCGKKRKKGEEGRGRGRGCVVKNSSEYILSHADVQRN